VTQGKETELFEKDICSYVGCKNAVVVNNGTSALITALLANGIGPGDEVIVPTFTFISSVNAIIAVGAKPVLVDSDLKTFNTTPEFMKKAMTKKTRAIMPVDVAGMPVDIGAFEEFAEENNLIIVEDAAEAIGAKYKNKKIGSFEHTAIFSFHMAKLVTTVEGGCIVTGDNEIAEKCSMVRNVGMRGRYDYKCFGLNLRITDIQSAIGRVQLKKIDSYLKLRNKLVKIYEEDLDMVDFQEIPDYVTLHPYMLFGVLVDKNKRDAIIKNLNQNNIGTRICWPPTHMQEYHKTIFKGRYPNAELLGSRIINLPMGNALTEDDVRYVTDVFKKSFE